MLTFQETVDAKLLAELNGPIQDLHAQLHPEIFKPYDQAGIQEFYAYLVQEDSFRFFTAHQSNSIVGYFVVETREYPESPFIHGYRALYVHQIFVMESARKQGIGAKIVDKIKALSREENCSRLELDVWLKNSGSTTFFEKSGFEAQKQILSQTID